MHDLKFVLFWLVLQIVQIVYNMPLDIRFCFAKSSNLDNLEFKYRQEAFPESFFVACENEFIKNEVTYLRAPSPSPISAVCILFCLFLPKLIDGHRIPDIFQPRLFAL